MGVGLFGRGWVPLGLGGSGAGSGRGSSAPTILQSPRSTGAVSFWEDFNATSLGTTGQPKWFITPSATGTAVLGTAGAGGIPGNAAGTAYNGVLVMTNGAVDDETTIVESGSTAGCHFTYNGSTLGKFLFAVRFGPGASSSSFAAGLALIPPSVAIGTDWIGASDPATILSGINALVLYKDTDVATTYSVTAISAAGSTNDVINATLGANTLRSFELYTDGTNLFGYSAGVLQFTRALPAAWVGTLIGWRASLLIKNRSGAARTLVTDYVYHETTFNVNR